MNIQALDAQLLPDAHANFRDFYRALALAAPDGASEEVDGVSLISTGLPLADVNLAIATRAPIDPSATIERAAGFYRQRGLPWKLYIPGAIADDLDEQARAVGLLPSHPEPGMLLAPLAGLSAPSPPSGVQVKVVANEADLATFRATAAGPLEADLDIFDTLFNPALLNASGLTLYLAEVDGRAVATAARFSSRRIAGVFVVATLPAYRRRGFGAYLTQLAALGGRNDGCLASYLQSWPLAYRLYQRLGYRHIVDYHTWLG